MSQTDLEGKPLPEPAPGSVESEIEVVEYVLYFDDKWKLKARKDAIEELFDEPDPDIDEKLRSFIQRKIRVRDKNTKIHPGDFDAGVEKMILKIKGE